MKQDDVKRAAIKHSDAYVASENLRGLRGSYNLGFIAGVEWCMNYLGEMPWDKAMQAIADNLEMRKDENHD